MIDDTTLEVTWPGCCPVCFEGVCYTMCGRCGQMSVLIVEGCAPELCGSCEVAA